MVVEGVRSVRSRRLLGSIIGQEGGFKRGGGVSLKLTPELCEW